MFYRAYLTGGYVLLEYMTGQVLQEVISFRGHVLQEHMSYMRACLAQGYVLWEDMAYRKTCFTGKYILLEDMSYKRTWLMESNIFVRKFLCEEILVRTYLTAMPNSCYASLCFLLEYVC